MEAAAAMAVAASDAWRALPQAALWTARSVRALARSATRRRCQPPLASVLKNASRKTPEMFASDRRVVLALEGEGEEEGRIT